jgi:SAM-dependent methyltransferase
MERAIMESAEHDIAGWLARHHPSLLISDPVDVVERSLGYHIALTYRRAGVLVDLGGGVNAVNGFLSELGMQVTVIDLLNEYYPFSTVNATVSNEVAYLSQMGVRFVEADLTSVDLRSFFDVRTVDVVATYHTLEHLHHSPKILLESAIDILKTGGTLVIEVPNAANLIKRAKLATGRTNYPLFSQFYDSEKWYGHIREYTIGDLNELAGSLALRQWRIEGRNWYGRLYRVIRNRSVARMFDFLLRTRPGLCGSLYLIGIK